MSKKKGELKMAVRQRESESVAAVLREIRDSVSRMLERQKEADRARRFAERQALFHSWLAHANGPGFAQVGFRVTALPGDALPSADEVFRNRGLSRGLHVVTGRWASNSQAQEFFPGRDDLSEHPVLGGAVWSTVPSVEKVAQQLILRNGLIDVWLKRPWHKERNDQQRGQPLLYFDWLLGVTGNVLLRVDSFRRSAQAAEMKYWLQLELLSLEETTSSKAQLKMGGALDGILGEGVQTPEIFGPYAIEDRDTVVNQIVRDLHDASGEGGLRPLPRLQMDWSEQ